jgi:hypothetical protein
MIKKCSKCKVEKDINEYYRNNTKPSGYQDTCKDCKRAYAKAYIARPEIAEKIRLQHKAYYAVPENKLRLNTRAKERQKTVEGAEYRREYQRTYRQSPEYHLRDRAYHKLRAAVKSGKIYKPDICSICNTRTEIEGHHEDHTQALEVMWVCEKCHFDIHHPNRLISRDQNESGGNDN